MANAGFFITMPRSTRLAHGGAAAAERGLPLRLRSQYLIFDRDRKFGIEVIAAVQATGIMPKRTSFQSPWQNGIAERWVGSCRCDLLDHIIAINERHLKRLLSKYISYHHEDRTHLGLAKQTPAARTACLPSGRIVSHRRMGGLHPL